MFKRIIVSFLVILAVGFTFVSCDSDKCNTGSLVMPYNARTTPLSLENYGSSDLKVTIEASFSGTNDSKLQYSIDGGEKQDVTLSASFDITVPAGGTISFYDDRPTTTENSTIYTIKCDKECYVYGNVMSLINPTDFKDLVSLENHEYAFVALFYQNTKIENHPKKPLVLPATTLNNGCYQKMFEGCSGLTAAPDLPATTLASFCYLSMFSGCYNLARAPKLPAETMADFCYYQMFHGCTSLTTAPDLPATTLANRCYFSMFSGCTGLLVAPALPATTMKDTCYYAMFAGCTNLISAPALPATTLAPNCYESMFVFCSSLTAAPELPASTLARACYKDMFKYCTSLTASPNLGAEDMVNECYFNMFMGCTNLSSVSCLAKTNAPLATTDWLLNTASSGTFTSSSAATFWPTNSSNGIPAGWSVNNI